MRSSFFLSIFIIFRHFLFCLGGCFGESFSLFEQFYTLLYCSIRFIEVFQISFQSQHIIDNVPVYIRFQSFIRFLDQNIPSLYTFRVGKADELQSIGLGVPDITKLCARLRAGGMPLPADIYTVEAAVAAIAPLLGGDAHAE